ncbi:MAG TPA: DUF6644 family protein [Pedobacter sp.]|uniref:DUF6644 family protein n=1 Tax=Pedobacter sp. TaxID=1411316 RepID=UPI002B919EA1|nr:DUF6644 family protein [Pedobacter sp.]HMI01998.1 DUF6644 family protein [Pedobacter sp.]
MPQTLTDFFSWLENTALAASIRQSLWLYPALEIVHIVGIVILVGGAFLFDLRLLGFAKNLPLKALSGHLLPWSQRGLLLIVPSGILLFMTNSKTLGIDPTFWLKMILLVLAAINVLVFHRMLFKPPHHPENPHNKELSAAAKISALVSISLWVAIIACGRLLAY